VRGKKEEKIGPCLLYDVSGKERGKKKKRGSRTKGPPAGREEKSSSPLARPLHLLAHPRTEGRERERRGGERGKKRRNEEKRGLPSTSLRPAIAMEEGKGVVRRTFLNTRRGEEGGSSS